MYLIKPNYSAGICTPWTLEDNDTWRATHRLAGVLWVIGGILITIVVLILPAKPAFIVFLSLSAILALVPIIYSYTYFKKHQANN